MINICRLCLNEVQEIPNELDDKCILQKEKIKLLMPEIDINIIPTFTLCSECTDSLNTAYEFKCACIQIEDFIQEYINTTKPIKLDLSDVRKQKLCDIEETLSLEEIEIGDVKTENNELITDVKTENPLSFACSKCNEVFYFYDQFQKHVQICLFYSCSECEQMFYSREQLKNHEISHNNRKLYMCDICKRSFKRKYDMRRHRVTVHRVSEIPENSAVALKVPENNIEPKEYNCLSCTKSFASREYLRRHMVNKHYGTHMCDTCGMKCGSKFTLEEHVRTHTGERPYKCEICGKGFAQRGSLNVHISTHSTAKPFECDKCGKAFTLSTYLKLHMKTHATSLEKSFVCTVCNKTFKLKKNLLQHARRHLPIRNHKCSICPKEFFLPHILRRHMMTHTGERPFECFTCHKKFSQKSNLQIHFRSHRPKNKSLKQSQ